MPTTLNEALARLDARITLTRGVPASAEWIASAQKSAKTTFCPTYVAFLQEHGALRFQAELGSWHGDFRLAGHSPDDPTMSLKVARTWLEDTAQEWNQEPPVGAPVLVTNGEWPDAWLTVDGGIARFHRHTAYPESDTFESLALRWIANASAELGAEEENTTLSDDLLGACAALIPAGFEPRIASGALTLTRPTDGVSIALRLGDGRELGGDDGSGVFASWVEEGERSLAQINEYNRGSAFVRAAHQPDRVRYRGLLPAQQLDPALLLAALAQDAELDLGIDAPPAMTLMELLPLLAEPPSEKPNRYPKRHVPSDIHREGDELRFCVATSSSTAAMLAGPAGLPDVRLRVRAHGLVEVRYQGAIGVAPQDALTALSAVNTNSLGGNNLDLEPCVKGSLDDSTATLSIVTTARALSANVFLSQLDELTKAIAKQTCLAEPDPMDTLIPQLEREFGLPLGIAGHALWENILNRRAPLIHDRFERRRTGPARLSSPWGEVVCFAEMSSSPGIGLATHIDATTLTLAISVAHGATFDECPVIGIGGGVTAGYKQTDLEAQLLAPDLESFLSVLVLGTSGYGFDGDDSLVWRDYRSQHSWFSPEDPTAELRLKLGIERTRDIGAIQAAAESKAGAPRSGRVRHGR